MILNRNVRAHIQRPDHEPGAHKRRQARRIVAERLAAQTGGGRALGDDAGEDGGGEEGQLLHAVGVRVLRALVALEAACGVSGVRALGVGDGVTLRQAPCP
jgi:hypothetical protein